jgi:hypothetical protein
MSEWLDTETKAILQPVIPDKLAPADTTGYTLVMLSRGKDEWRLLRALKKFRSLSNADAKTILYKPCPLPVANKLTLVDAYLGQFELICCDTVAIFIADEVAQEAEESYLRELISWVRESTEFQFSRIEVDSVPNTEEGQRFLDQFLGWYQKGHLPPMPIIKEFMRKKTRLMEHWGEKIGASIHYGGRVIL